MAYGIGLVALILFIISVLTAYAVYKLEQNGIHTEAEVIKLERSGGSYFPVFKFQDIKGRELTVKSSTSSESYFVGDIIPIIYDAHSPLSAKVNDPLMLYLLSMITGFLGSLFLFSMFFILKALPFFEKAYDQQRAKHDKKNT